MSTTTTAPHPPAGDRVSGELTHRQILTILTGLMMGMFLAALDQTIVATAIRTIADDLQGQSIQAWVTTAYLVTSTISTPLYGKLSDIYGRKKFFISAISIFVVGSFASTFATSMYMLAGFRALQGVGAGGLFSLALAIIGDIVPPRERAKYQGYFLAVFGSSSVLGPVIGGWFAGQSSLFGVTGWRWVFLVNVPIGIAALFVVSATLHLPTRREEHRIDWWGAAAIILALVPLLIVAEQGRVWGWGSTTSIACFVTGGVGVILFILAERMAGEDALIPLRIFQNRTISITVVGSVIVGMGMFGGLTVIPLYLQIVKGATPTSSGFMMLPMVLGIMVASVLSGQITYRTGRIREFPIFGTALMVVGFALLWRVGADTPLSHTMAFMFIFGFGLGNTMQPLTLIVQNAVAPTEIGMATSAATFFRQMGGTMGVAIFLSILFNNLPTTMTNALGAAKNDPTFISAVQDPAVQANPANAGVLALLTGKSADFLTGLMNDTSALERIDKRLAHPFEVGFSDAMDQIFFMGGCLVVIGLIVLLFMPKVELRNSSAMSAARADAEGDTAAHAEGGPAAEYGGDTAAESGGAPRGDDADSSASPDSVPVAATSAEPVPAGAPAGGSAPGDELHTQTLRIVTYEARHSQAIRGGRYTGRHRD